MKHTIRQLREERGESLSDLAMALRATTVDITELEDGIAHPSVVRLHQLAAHFGVDHDAIDLAPNEPPSLGEQIVEVIEDA